MNEVTKDLTDLQKAVDARVAAAKKQAEANEAAKQEPVTQA